MLGILLSTYYQPFLLTSSSYLDIPWFISSSGGGGNLSTYYRTKSTRLPSIIILLCFILIFLNGNFLFYLSPSSCTNVIPLAYARPIPIPIALPQQPQLLPQDQLPQDQLPQEQPILRQPQPQVQPQPQPQVQAPPQPSQPSTSPITNTNKPPTNKNTTTTTTKPKVVQAVKKKTMMQTPLGPLAKEDVDALVNDPTKFSFSKPVIVGLGIGAGFMLVLLFIIGAAMTRRSRQ